MRRFGARDRGAVAIEAALIFPVLALLVVGIIEWSLVLKDQLELTAISRSGARTGSTLSPIRPWQPPTTPMTEQVVDSLVSAASNLPRDTIDYVLVYEAGDDGKPLSGTFDCVSGETCEKYTWDPDSGTFTSTGNAPWTGETINACLGDSPGRPDMTDIGVYIKSTHRMVTGMFGATRDLSAHSVMRFEPAPPGRCNDPEGPL